jgi:hypothetical protein
VGNGPHQPNEKGATKMDNQRYDSREHPQPSSPTWAEVAVQQQQALEQEMLKNDLVKLIDQQDPDVLQFISSIQVQVPNVPTNHLILTLIWLGLDNRNLIKELRNRSTRFSDVEG